MLQELYPRCHARFSSLPLLGSHVEEFVAWLRAEGYPRLPIRLRIAQLPRVDRLLRRRGTRRIEDLTAFDLIRLTPKNSQDDIYLSATVRSLVRIFTVQGRLAQRPETPLEELVSAYRSYLARVRGFAESTRAGHSATAAELLSFLGFDDGPAGLEDLGPRDIESFLRKVGPRVGRGTLQHMVGHLRSFLRFLANRGLVVSGLDACIDTPRLYRGEHLPRALPWKIVRAFLAAIDRSTAMGKRDYAMFLLIATYGLRTSEVSGLRLDDIEWRPERLRISKPKTKTPLVLPLTEEVGAGLVDYLRHARPQLPYREVFLRVRAPEGRLRPTAVTEAFQGWTRRSGLPIPYQGPHCLRHSLAVQLLRQGAPLKTIGDLLGHRTAESTCVYLRLNVEDLRDVALDLPAEVRS
ncbi:MAG: tyrosine-type recombinase/integrase [Candidatus Eisenbacteria sp.]|nr:tyrosine-type recombinase/integrase [Candidatus Eisenbacteria bacterium]